MTTAEKIKNLRVKNNLTQKEFSELVGIAHGSVSNYERGLTKPSEITLNEIAHAFSVNLSELLPDNDVKYKDKTEEGYNDPTASAAIHNQKGDVLEKLYPGAVYGIRLGKADSTQALMGVLCLNYDDENIYGLSIYRRGDIPPAGTSHMFNINGFYIDIRGTKCFNRTRIVKELFFFNDHKDFVVVKNAMAAKLGLPYSTKPKVIEKIVEVPVEKVVEKMVEVPVEKIVEIPADNSVELQLATQRAVIYEDICNKLLARGVTV